MRFLRLRQVRPTLFGSRAGAGQEAPDPAALSRLHEVLSAAAASGEARHVYITGGSMLGPEQEVERFLPVVETCRRAVGNRLTVTCGSGAVDRVHSQRLKEAGADSCCYNLEVWDPQDLCGGAAREIQVCGQGTMDRGSAGAVEVFGRARVSSAFVAGIELLPPVYDAG